MNDHRLIALAAGDAEAVRWIIDACQRVLIAGGSIGIEQAAGLATTPESRRRALRDFNLARAAAMVGGTPLALHRSVEDFRRACWPLWRAMRHAPASASPLERALDGAFRCGSVPTTAQGLGKVLRGFGFRNETAADGFPLS